MKTFIFILPFRNVYWLACPSRLLLLVRFFSAFYAVSPLNTIRLDGNTRTSHMWMIEKRWTEKLFVLGSLKLTKSIKARAHEISRKSFKAWITKKDVEQKTIKRSDQEKCSIKMKGKNAEKSINRVEWEIEYSSLVLHNFLFFHYDWFP